MQTSQTFTLSNTLTFFFPSRLNLDVTMVVIPVAVMCGHLLGLILKLSVHSRFVHSDAGSTTEGQHSV